MEANEKQLLDRVQREQAQMSGNPNFQRLLSEASAMRQAQDDEILLEGQKREQLSCFASAKQRLKQLNRIMEVIKSCEGKSTETIFDDLDHEFDRAVRRLEDGILPQRRKLELMLLHAEKEAAASNDSERDMENIDEMASQLENLLIKKKYELDSLGGLRGEMAALNKVPQKTTAQSMINSIYLHSPSSYPH